MPDERDADAVPERELTADEVRVVENRVEACRPVVGRVLVARGEEERGAEALVVVINRRLGRGHVRLDARLLARDGVARVGAEREVVRVRQIDAAEVAVARQTEVADLDRVRPRVADDGRADFKAVAVVLDPRAVVVEVKARLRRVALREKVLPEEVGDVDVLPPTVEAVEAAVGVLLQLREVGEVELVLVVPEGAEDARAEVVVGVDEAAEVRDERLDADAHGDGVVVRVHVFELHLGEGFLEGELPVGARRAAPRVDVQDALLARADVVRDAEGGREFDGPLARLEGRVAAEHLKRELEDLIEGEHLGLAEGLGAAGSRAATGSRGWACAAAGRP